MPFFGVPAPRQERGGAANVRIVIKDMETDEEVRGKAYVHWCSWQETYPGMMDGAYLAARTLEKCEEKAFRWRDGILVAKDGERVAGFVGFGAAGDSLPDAGEVFALYVLPEYCGQGVGGALMDAALERLRQYRRVCLWVLKENARAIRFYEKRGFRRDGAEKYSETVGAVGIRMVLQR